MERQALNITHPVRDEIEDDIVQQIRNEVQETLLLHAPQRWSDEACEAVEQSVLDHTRMVLDALTTAELQSSGALLMHIGQAVAETKRLIRCGGLK